MLELLAGLVDKSLVNADPRADGVRYRLLETLRHYAHDRLAERGELKAAQRAHAAYYLALAEEAEPALRGSDQVMWSDRLEQEHDNFRAALAWCQEREPELALRLAVALSGFWRARGYMREGRRWLDQMLAQTSARTPTRVQALRVAGVLARMQGDFASDRTYCEECLRLAGALGDKDAIAAALFWRGTVTWADGEYDETRRLYEQSLAIRRELDDKRTIAAALLNLAGLAYEVEGDYGRARALLDERTGILREMGHTPDAAVDHGALSDVAHYEGDYAQAQALAQEQLACFRNEGNTRSAGWALRHLGQLAVVTGDHEQARMLLEESLALLREVEDQWGTALALGALANLARQEGDEDRARALMQEALPLAQATGDKTAIARCLWYAGVLAMSCGAYTRAACLLGAAAAAHRRLRTYLRPEERDEHDRALAAARAALGEAAFAKAWAKGQTMAADEAIQYALSAEQ